MENRNLSSAADIDDLVLVAANPGQWELRSLLSYRISIFIGVSGAALRAEIRQSIGIPVQVGNSQF